MNPYMKVAIEEAQVGIRRNDGGPFGCVIVKNGEIIGRGHNEIILRKDPTCHAEMMAIRDACKNLGVFNLAGCVLYSTSEPCEMCRGAIQWAGIERVYYGCRQSDSATLIRALQEQETACFIEEELDRNECLKVYEEYREMRYKTEY